MTQIYFLYSLFEVVSSVATAAMCRPVSGFSPQLTAYANNGSMMRLSAKRVPCQNSISLSTGKQCGAFGRQREWTRFTLHKNDPEKSGSKRNELSVPNGEYVLNGDTVTYGFSTIIPRRGVYLLESPKKARNSAVVFFQIKGVNGFSPALAARVRNDGKLCITKDNRILKRKPNGETYYESIREELYVGDMEDLWGKPLQFRFQVHFDPNENGRGFVAGNLNGRRIFTHRGPMGFHSGESDISGAGQKGYYAKFGIYNSNKVNIPENVNLAICHRDFSVTQKNQRNNSPDFIKASHKETDIVQ